MPCQTEASAKCSASFYTGADFARLGDQRRNQRLVNITEHLAAHPGGMLPQTFPDRAELKAVYRFFWQRGVTFERILAPHLERTRQTCRQPGEYLLSEDTTLLDYSGDLRSSVVERLWRGVTAPCASLTLPERCGFMDFC